MITVFLIIYAQFIIFKLHMINIFIHILHCSKEGVWTREGCDTSEPEPGYGEYLNDTFINCTCNHLSSFAVILNDAEAEVSGVLYSK